MSQLPILLQAAAAGAVIAASGVLPPLLLNEWAARNERKRIDQKKQAYADFIASLKERKAAPLRGPMPGY